MERNENGGFVVLLKLTWNDLMIIIYCLEAEGIDASVYRRALSQINDHIRAAEGKR